MAYIINNYNTAQLTVVEDGTIDQTTDLKLVGKNYAGYGEIQNENNVRVFLLQNEHQTMEQRISDFHLLLCLPKLFTIDIAISIAKSIGKKTTLDDYCRAVINAFMKHKTI